MPKRRDEKNLRYRPFRAEAIRAIPAKANPDVLSRSDAVPNWTAGAEPIEAEPRVESVRLNSRQLEVGSAPAFELLGVGDDLRAWRVGVSGKPHFGWRELSAAARVDLHGRRASEARGLLASELKQAARKGVMTVEIIVGRGRHSLGQRSALFEVVEEALQQTPIAQLVLAFAARPTHVPPSASIMVLLRLP